MTPAEQEQPAFAEVIAKLRSRHHPTLARTLSTIERGGTAAAALDRLLYPLGGNAHVVGITGAPGAGKSTLVDGLVTHLRRRAGTVAVLAVDPSSARSGGAVLGDRIRMAPSHATDEGVFVRSMASRGRLGGLAAAAFRAVRAFDAAGFDWVIVETVGVGQSEIDIVGVADTTIVVVNPGYGDDVQAAKAGILEIADCLVINKSDRDGVEATERELRQMLHVDSSRRSWTPPVVRAVAADGFGLDDVATAIEEHRLFLAHDGRLRAARERRVTAEIRSLLHARLLGWIGEATSSERFTRLRADVVARRVDPGSATAALLAAIAGDGRLADPDG